LGCRTAYPWRSPTSEPKGFCDPEDLVQRATGRERDPSADDRAGSIFLVEKIEGSLFHPK
jgi:hypothetical protein